MLIDYFLERSRIELAANGQSYHGFVPDLPELQVSAATAEECRHKLEAAVAALLSAQAPTETSGSENRSDTNDSGADHDLVNTFELLITDTPNEIETNHTAAESAFATILYEKKDWVARVTINRPDAYNAY